MNTFATRIRVINSVFFVIATTLSINLILIQSLPLQDYLSVSLLPIIFGFVLSIGLSVFVYHYGDADKKKKELSKHRSSS